MSGSRGLVSGIALPPREAIEYLRGKTNVTSQHWTDVWREAHARSFMVAGAATDALVGDFRSAVGDALEQGTTLRDFRARFDDIVSRHGWVHNGTPAWRSRIIYETNLSMAYAAGRYAQQTEPDTLAVYPYWQYVHSGAAHPRLQHQAWNGLVLRADDGFWKTHYPPNGWRCGCRVRVLSARALARQGRSGPDQAPEIETREWTNPRTGEVHRVPQGIDPGFDYNPGEAWRGPPQVPGDAVTRRPPAAWPPPVPSGDASASSAPAQAQPPVRLGRPPDRLPGQSVMPRRFRDIDEADATLTAEAQPWANGLSEFEREALAAYKSGLGRQMNAVLRGDEPPVRALSVVTTALREALMRSRTRSAVRVFRGVATAEADRLRSAGIGGEAQLPAFVSSSLDIDIAKAYLRREDGVLVELLLPRGLRGAAYIHPFPAYRYPQRELLLAPGASYRVIAIETDRIVVEVLRHGRD